MVFIRGVFHVTILISSVSPTCCVPQTHKVDWQTKVYLSSSLVILFLSWMDVIQIIEIKLFILQVTYSVE